MSFWNKAIRDLSRPKLDGAKRRFVCHFWFTGLSHISLGMHVDLYLPNIEIHVPMGFIKIGWNWNYQLPSLNSKSLRWRGFGYNA